jgi:hypothetical protein
LQASGVCAPVVRRHRIEGVWILPAGDSFASLLNTEGRAVSQLQPVAHVDLAPCTFSGCELQHGAGAVLGRNSPGGQRFADVENPQLAIEEQGVYREAHESGMDGWRRPQQHSLPGGQAAAPYQPP